MKSENIIIFELRTEKRDFGLNANKWLLRMLLIFTWVTDPKMINSDHYFTNIFISKRLKIRKIVS